MKNSKIKITYFNGYNEDLCKELGISEEEAWKYICLDDWDYALIVDGRLSRNKYDELMFLLNGCYENKIKYIPLINKTIGLSYHA